MSTGTDPTILAPTAPENQPRTQTSRYRIFANHGEPSRGLYGADLQSSVGGHDRFGFPTYAAATGTCVRPGRWTPRRADPPAADVGTDEDVRTEIIGFHRPPTTTANTKSTVSASRDVMTNALFIVDQ